MSVDIRPLPVRNAEILKILSTSEFLTHSDLLGKDWTFEIVSVGLVTIEKNAVVKKTATKCAIRFKGPKKPFAFGVTVYKSILKLYGEPGPEGRNWVGKLLTIFPTTDEQKGQDCIRVRPTRPAKPSTEPMPEVPVDVEAAVKKAKAFGDLPPDFDASHSDAAEPPP